MELWLNDKLLELIAFIYIPSHLGFMFTFLPLIIGLLHYCYIFALVLLGFYIIVKHFAVVLSCSLSCQATLSCFLSCQATLSCLVVALSYALSFCQTSVFHTLYLARHILPTTSLSFYVVGYSLSVIALCP